MCALAQLLLDPYYRTTSGFLLLVEKEFGAFGHQIATRTAATSKPVDTNAVGAVCARARARLSGFESSRVRSATSACLSCHRNFILSEFAPARAPLFFFIVRLYRTSTPVPGAW